MATMEAEVRATRRAESLELPNGAAMAAFLAAGIGAFATGAIVLLSEMGVLSVPAIYEPAGGVSGRTTLAVAVWLLAWGILHGLWKNRELPPGTIAVATLALIVLGILGTFPPVWGLVS